MNENMQNTQNMGGSPPQGQPQKSSTSFWIIIAAVLGVCLICFIAIVGILAAIAVPNFLNAQIRAKVARSHADIRMLPVALDMIQLDNDKIPLPNNSRYIDNAFFTQENGVNSFLTTPVSYIAVFPKDPFNKDGRGYRYFAADADSRYYIIVGNGPDGDIDFDERTYRGEDIDFHPNQKFLYDPSNGLESSGDIMRWQVASKKP